MRNPAVIIAILAVLVGFLVFLVEINAPRWAVSTLAATYLTAIILSFFYFRWKYWFVAMLTTAASTCLLMGSMGITLSGKARIADGNGNGKEAWVDFFVRTSSDAVSISLIIAGLALFGLAALIYMREVERQLAAQPSAPPPDPGMPWYYYLWPGNWFN